MSQIQVAGSEPAANSIRASTVLQCGNVWDRQSDNSLGLMEILVHDGKMADMDRKVARPLDTGSWIQSIPWEG